MVFLNNIVPLFENNTRGKIRPELNLVYRLAFLHSRAQNPSGFRYLAIPSISFL
jgi:hypothetical protein